MRRCKGTAPPLREAAGRQESYQASIGEVTLCNSRKNCKSNRKTGSIEYSLDRVVLLASAAPWLVAAAFGLAELDDLGAKPSCLPQRGDYPRWYRTILSVTITCPEVLEILLRSAERLGGHRVEVCRAELAEDTWFPTKIEAMQHRRALCQVTGKRWTRRRNCIEIGTTTYWENRSARTALKIYVREPKDGSAGWIVRREITFNRAKKCREMGLSTAADLIACDIAGAMNRVQCPRQINYAGLGKILFGNRRGRDAFARMWCDQQGPLFHNADHLRGHLRRIRSGAQVLLRQFPRLQSNRLHRLAALTDRQINYATAERYSNSGERNKTSCLKPALAIENHKIKHKNRLPKPYVNEISNQPLSNQNSHIPYSQIA